MKMNEFMTALQTHLATQQPNYPGNAESILEMLFDAYNESSGFDNAAIKANFEELYRLMNGKPLKRPLGLTSLNVIYQTFSYGFFLIFSYKRIFCK